MISANHILSLFTILSLGLFIGKFTFKGFSLGAAGVLIIGIIFGSFHYKLPDGIIELGLILFFYSVGLQSGPQFFGIFKKSSRKFLVIGLVPIFFSFTATILLYFWSDLPPELILGIFTGSLTSTPSLAAAMDILGQLNHKSLTPELVSLSYGFVYPFSLLLVVAALQIIPKIMKKDLEIEKKSFEEDIKKHHDSLITRQFRISNPNCDGLRIKEFNPQKNNFRRNEINILSIQRDNQSFPASADFILKLEDILTIVGSINELETMKLIIGEELITPFELDNSISVIEVEVSENELVGKTLRELSLYENYKVLITRINRQDIEFVATGNSELLIGDQIQVVGTAQAVTQFVEKISAHSNTLEDTQMFSFVFGLLLGIIVGSLRIPLPGGMHLELGLAGGILITSLLLGFYGKLFSFKMYVPQAAKNFCREFGIILFLAGVGTQAGALNLFRLFSAEGFFLVVMSLVLALISILTTFIISYKFYRDNVLGSLGYICGNMNNISGIAALRLLSKSDLPALSYTAIYPLSLVFKIIFTQILVLIFSF
jgi:putative transport protein